MEMKYKILIVALLNTYCFLANADNYNSYVKAESGVSIFSKLKSQNYSDKPNSTMHLHLSVGRKISNSFHVELHSYNNYSKYQEIKKDTLYNQDFETHAGFVNVTYDIGKYNIATPFITAGLGMSFNKTYTLQAMGGNNGIRGGESNFSPAYSIGIGTKVSISPTSDMVFGYKYMNLGLATTGADLSAISGSSFATPIKAKITHQTLSVGMIYRF